MNQRSESSKDERGRGEPDERAGYVGVKRDVRSSTQQMNGAGTRDRGEAQPHDLQTPVDLIAAAPR